MRWPVVVIALALTVSCSDSLGPGDRRQAHSIQLNLPSVSLDDGATTQLTASVFDQDGVKFDTLPANLHVSWTSSVDSVASVNNAGTITAHFPGTSQVTATVTAAAGTLTAHATVTVNAVPTALTLVAGNNQTGTVAARLPVDLSVKVLERHGLGVAGETVTFVVASGTGSLTAATVTTDATGAAAVGFTPGTVAGTAQVDATTARVAATAVHFSIAAHAGPPAALVKQAGDAQSAIVTTLLPVSPVVRVNDAFGNAVSGAAVAWSVASGGGSTGTPSGASDAAGLASVPWTLGGTVGVQALDASINAGAVTASFSATGLPIPVATVQVQAPAPTLPSGASEQLAVTLLGASAQVLTGRVVTWSSSDAAIVSVDANGVAQGLHTGTATITATSEGKSGTQDITVVASATASVITVGRSSIQEGDTTLVTLTSKDVAGNPVTQGGLSPVFIVGNPAVGSIGAAQDHGDGTYTAIFTAISAGTVGVSAELLPGYFVQPQPLPSITVTALPPVISAFTAAAASVTAGTGTTLTGTFSHGTGSVDHGVGAVTSGIAASTGPLAVSTTFTLTVTNSAGAQVTATAPVTVIPAPAITSFLTNNGTAFITISTGGTATFTPVFTDGTGSIDQGIGAVVSGTPITTGPLTTTTTYTLTVTNSLGATVTKTVIVTVAVPTIAATLDIPGPDIIGTGLSAPLVVTLAQPAGVGGLTVTITSDDPAIAAAVSPGSVVVPEGATTARIDISGLIAGSTTLHTSGNGVGAAALPVQVTSTINTVQTNELSVGAHNCAIRAGVAYCWGPNTSGQLGDGSGSSQFPLPIRVVTNGQTFVSISAGMTHTCALTAAGQAWCWGVNTFGQLGDGTTDPSFGNPHLVPGGQTWAKIVTGDSRTCGLTVGGAAYCWGYNLDGGIGDGSIGSAHLSPTAVAGSHTFVDIAVTYQGPACGLTPGGEAWCWGTNAKGGAGDGTVGNTRPTPVQVVGGLTFARLAPGYWHSCGVTTGNAVYCWGATGSGQVGTGSTFPDVGSPQLVAGGHALVQVSAGVQSTCGLDAAGTAYCWGDNSFGQLGIGNTTDQSVPTAVLGGLAFRTLIMGVNHACGITLTDQYACWGINPLYNIGDGTLGNKTTPVVISPNGPPALLTLTAPPSTTKAGVVMAPIQFSVTDGLGNTAAPGGSVTLQLSNDPSNGLPGNPSGTLTAPVVNGVATFSDLVFATPGVNYRFQANLSVYVFLQTNFFSIVP